MAVTRQEFIVSAFFRMLWSCGLASFKFHVPSRGEMCTGCASPEASWVHFSALLATQTPFLHVDAVEVLPNSIFGVNVVWFITKYCRSLIYADLTFAVSQVVMKMHGVKSYVALLRHEFGTGLEAGVQGWVSHVTSGLSGSPTSPSQWNLLMATLPGRTAPRIKSFLEVLKFGRVLLFCEKWPRVIEKQTTSFGMQTKRKWNYLKYGAC